MPKGYRWNDPVTGTALSFVTEGLVKHTRVARCVELERGSRYCIERTGSLAAVNLWLTNVYILSESDVAAILAEWPEVNCILSASSFNSYTEAAERAARDADVGVYMWAELFAALHHKGDSFLGPASS